MRRIISLLGAIGLSALSIVACSDDDLIVGPTRPLTPNPGRGGNGGDGGTAGRGGSAGAGETGGSSNTGTAGSGGSTAGIGGTAGAPGVAEAGGAESDAGTDAGGEAPDASDPVLVDAVDAGPFIRCVETPDCNDVNDCTTEVCNDQVCVFTPVAIGEVCGDTTTVSECTQPDTCDGAGVCLGNDQPDGTLCEDGHCNTQGACDCAVERVTAAPYGQQWQTTGDTELDLYQDCQICAGTADHVVVFTAAVTGTYRFTAASSGDAELAVVEGDCSGTLAEPSCGADIDAANEDYADQLELEIEAGATVTVVVGESCEENGGVGNLSIERVPEGG